MTAESPDSRPSLAEESASPHADRLSALMQANRDIVIFLDEVGRIERANTRLTAELGHSVSDIIGEPVDTLIADDPDPDPDREYASLTAILDSLMTEDGEAVLVPVTTAAGEHCPMRLHGSPIRSEEGRITGLIAIISPADAGESDAALLERQRDEFALFNQILRHDIRNDANLILELTRGLRRDDPPPKMETMLEQLEEGANRIVDLTERARELIAALEALDSERVPVELAPILTEEVAKASTVSPVVSVVLEDDIPAVAVMANDMVGAVFRNLLSNAIHHNDADDPEVRVEASVDEETVTVSVVDNGPGLPPAVEAMVEAGGVSLDDASNAGFGLYIVTTLLDRFGGSLAVEANTPRGSIFRVTLERTEHE